MAERLSRKEKVMGPIPIVAFLIEEFLEKKKKKKKRKKISQKGGSTQNRTGVPRTKILYAAPTPWNLSNIKKRKRNINKNIKKKKI